MRSKVGNRATRHPHWALTRTRAEAWASEGPGEGGGEVKELIPALLFSFPETSGLLEGFHLFLKETHTPQDVF